MAFAVAGGRGDGCGGVVAGVVPGISEAADVAAVADEVGGDDGADPVHVGHCRVCRSHGDHDALGQRGELGVDAADLAEELEGDLAAGDTDGVDRLEAA